MPLDALQLAVVEAMSRPGLRGVYLWGTVGRGKSWLMACYFDLLPTERKTRIHFHTFFAALHALLHRHGPRLGDVLDEMLGDVEVVCFDEFHRGQVWFDFADLCATPTAPADYAAIADTFTWWVISGVPDPSDMEREPTRRFVHVVDVLYDLALRTDILAYSTAKQFLSRTSSFTGPARTISRLHSLNRSTPPH